MTTARGGARGRRPWRRLAGLLALFLGLTAAGAWWAAPDADALAAAWAHLAALPRRTHALLAALAAGVIAAEMLRLYVFGRALGVRLGARAALDATIANNFFSHITPGAALGEPAAAYVLGLHGVPWDAAVLISFGKFATSFAFILTLTCALLALGLGPPVPAWVVAPFAAAIGIGAALMLSLVAGAVRPRAAERAIDRTVGRLARRLDSGPVARAAEIATGAVHRLARFRRGGVAGSVAVAAAILGSHAAYYGALIGVLVALAGAFGAPAAEAGPIAVVYQGFLFLMPTPGASGVGEASAAPFFGALLPGGAAFAVVVLSRALTTYLHVAIGLVYLPVVGAMSAVLSGRSRVEPEVVRAEHAAHAAHADRADRAD